MAVGLSYFSTVFFNPGNKDLLVKGSYRKFLKRGILLPFVYNLGLHKVIGASENKGKMILCYHGVVDKPDFFINNRHMSAKQFEEDMLYLKSRFEIVPLSQFSNPPKKYLASGKKLLALTFDDGYENNFQYAAPILEKHKIPATFYIVTDSIENENFMIWCDLIDFVKSVAQEDLIFDGKIFRKELNFSDEESQVKITDYIKKMSVERDAALLDFEKRYQKELTPFLERKSHWKLMNPSQIKILSQNPLFEIGSHTKKHYCLGNTDPSLTKTELLESKLVLESLIQKEVTSIAFPDGSYNELAIFLAQRAGYKHLLGVNPENQPGDSKKEILPRWPVSNSTTHQSNMIRLSLDWNKLAH